jgi:exopolysaccharide biosynthesis polyprenyl glycosylphosphotransferase
MMRRKSHVLVYAPTVALVDLLLIHLSFAAMFFLEWGRHWSAMASSANSLHPLPYIFVVNVCAMYALDLYANWIRRRKDELVYSILVATVLMFVLTEIILRWEGKPLIPQRLILGAMVLQFFSLSTFRLGLRTWFVSGIGRKRVILLAPDDETAQLLFTKIEECAPEWIDLSGYLLPDRFDDLGDQIALYDAVLMAPKLPAAARIVKKCAELRKEVMVIPAILELSMCGASSLEIDDVLVFNVNPPQLTFGQSAVKRILDICVSAFLLVLTAPIIALAAICIRVTSAGPVIFKQERVGRGGNEFQLYKFRTMIHDAEKESGPVLAQHSDPRVTKVGRLLRATRIDELPQLLNVFAGDMSLIGPRPERKFFVDQFLDSVPAYAVRLAVKPGITGLAQVAGGYSTSVERKLRFDLLYIYNYSLMMDFRILLRTVPVVLNKAKGSASKVSKPPTTIWNQPEECEDSTLVS